MEKQASDYRPNEILIDGLVAVLSEDIAEVRAFRNELKDGRRDERELIWMIIEAFPSPIAEQLRALFSLVPGPNESTNATYYLSRIRQMQKTYQVLMDYLLFLRMAESMNALGTRKGPKPKFSSDFRSFFYEDHLSGGVPGYLSIFQQWSQQWDNLDFDGTFISEWSSLQFSFEAKDREASGMLWLQSLHARLNRATQLSDSEWRDRNAETEVALVDVFRRLNFLPHYKLRSIKEIWVQKGRTQLARFQHRIVPLAGAMTGFVDEQLVMERYLSPGSVLLFRDDDDDSFLNLKPFIIDKRALDRREGSQIFFLNFYNEEMEEVHYYSPMRAERLVVSQEQYPQLLRDLQKTLQLLGV